MSENGKGNPEEEKLFQAAEGKAAADSGLIASSAISVHQV
jgi:hypothetical protein